MIKLKNLVKTYKMGSTTVKALDGINLEVADGTFITIMGRSGSGKTTLLNMIGCLDRPDNGYHYN
ncbi:MAG: ATP-binding cassette domain-containing protein [Bacilli bacterium]